MRSSKLFLVLRAAAIAAGLAIVAPLSTPAQTFAANTGTTPNFRPEANPAKAPRIKVPGHHRTGHEDLIFARVRDGMYTVDGIVAKVRLDYDISGAKFLYLFTPGLGTAVLGLEDTPDVPTERAQLKDNELSFRVGSHDYRLSGIALKTDKGKTPQKLYVRMDTGAWQLATRAMVGFGDAPAAPYAWPAAAPANPAATRADAETPAPAVPAVLLPSKASVTPPSPAETHIPAVGMKN